MRIRRTDCEDAEDTDELLAAAITDDIVKWLQAWLGDPVDGPVGLDTKADIYHVVTERIKRGVVI